jgi:hypothetical protein
MATPEEEATDMIKKLILAACPERQPEVAQLWQTCSPVIAQQHDAPGFLMAGGPFGLITFTLRTMQQIWLIGFAAEAAFSAYCVGVIHALLYGHLDLDLLSTGTNHSYDSLIAKVEELRIAERSSDVSWPPTVPRPEDGKPTDVKAALVFDLVCMAGAYCFLHELHHVKLSSSETNGTLTPQEEELQCDGFARSMLLEKIAEYSTQTGYRGPLLNTKRAMSIGLGVLVVLGLTDSASDSQTHPAVAERIDALAQSLALHPNDGFWMYLGSLLIAHLRYRRVAIGMPKVRSIKELCFELIDLLPSAA